MRHAEEAKNAVDSASEASNLSCQKGSRLSSSTASSSQVIFSGAAQGMEGETFAERKLRWQVDSLLKVLKGRGLAPGESVQEKRKPEEDTSSQKENREEGDTNLKDRQGKRIRSVETEKLREVLERRRQEAEHAEQELHRERVKGRELAALLAGAVAEDRRSKEKMCGLEKIVESLKEMSKRKQPAEKGLKDDCAKTGAEFSEAQKKQRQKIEELEIELSEEKKISAVFKKEISCFNRSENDLLAEIDAATEGYEQSRREVAHLKQEKLRKDGELSEALSRQRVLEERLRMASEVGPLLDAREKSVSEKEATLERRKRECDEKIEKQRQQELDREERRREKDVLLEEVLVKIKEETSRRDEAERRVSEECSRSSKAEQTLLDNAREIRRLREEVEISSAVLEADNRGGYLKDTREQLVLYRQIVRCSVCEERDKDTVILRCCHVFCSSCVDDRVKRRQRKCPACGESFGVNDVKRIYL
ncbi:MAG: E3 ubiquitin-protein ligase BRE1 [Amphiamblys sp. WSBS2006]|nr:MAG: E3 ubiquitin-protein ligase BRE1 [Amphiamblys sp. WSBS2006]